MSKQTTLSLSTPELVVGPKEDAKSLKWLALATEKSQTRPAFNGLFVKNGTTSATDGFRLHVAPTPETIAKFDEQIVYSDWPAAGKQGLIAQVQTIEETSFPSTIAIIERTQQTPVAAKVRIAGKYLRDFCEGLNETDHVEITISKDAGRMIGLPVILATVPDNGENYGATPKRFACIMPISKDKDGEYKHPAYNPLTDK